MCAYVKKKKKKEVIVNEQTVAPRRGLTDL